MGEANQPPAPRPTIIDNINAPIRPVWLIRPVEDLVFNLTGFPDTNPGPISVVMPMTIQSSIGQETVPPAHEADLVQLFAYNSPPTGPNPRPLPTPQRSGPQRILRKPGALLPPRTQARRINLATGGYEVQMNLGFENNLNAGAPQDDVIELVVNIQLAVATFFLPVNFRRRVRFIGGSPTAMVDSFDSFDVYIGDVPIAPIVSVVGVRRLAPVADLTNPADVAPPDYVFLPRSTRYFNADGAAPGLDPTGDVALPKDPRIVITRLPARVHKLSAVI